MNNLSRRLSILAKKCSQQRFNNLKTLAIAGVFFHHIHMIIIKLDRGLDEEMYAEFVDIVVGGVNFGERMKKMYPDITKENYKGYLQNFYALNNDVLNQNMHELQNEVVRGSNDFFMAIEKIFGKDFSKNKYTGALSIFDNNPRFIEKRLFQVFYKRDLIGKLGVVYHEILHFIFFEYCEQHCVEAVYERSVNNGAYWELSEIVNVIILNQPAFQTILQRREQMFYPSLATILPNIQELWDKHKMNLPQFVVESLKILDARNK